jgi:alanine racemase
MQTYNCLKIDLSAVRYNLESVRSKLPPKGRVMPMVKASAYGTEAYEMAKYFEQWGIEIVGVSHVAEGKLLRDKGCTLSIFTIFVAPFEVQAAVAYDLEVSVSDLSLCLALNEEALKLGKQVKVHLAIDTGMRRFGCRADEALPLALEISKLPGLIFEGVMTHFVGAENTTFDTLSSQQIETFRNVLCDLQEHSIKPHWIHAANSAASLRFSLPFCNMARVGAATFGLYSSEAEKKEMHLRPALTLESCVVAINECHQGEALGYSQSYIVKRKTERIAILPLGYHDGFHIHTSDKGYVLIQGKKAPFVGRICMDFMMVDITEIPECKVGDPVILFGKGLPIEELAAKVGTNVRELVACLGPRIARVFIPEPIALRSLYKSEAQASALPC